MNTSEWNRSRLQSIHFVTAEQCCVHTCSYPPVLGADNQQAALSEGAEGNALAALAVDRFRLLLKHWVRILHPPTHRKKQLGSDALNQSKDATNPLVVSGSLMIFYTSFNSAKSSNKNNF